MKSNYIEKIRKNLEQGKSVKSILKKIYEQTGAFEIQQNHIENLLKSVLDYQKLYEKEKERSEKFGLEYKLEAHHKELISRETGQLLTCLQKLLKPILVADSTYEGKHQISKLILDSIYESEDVCDVPARFEIAGIGVFDIDLIFEKDGDTMEITLDLSLEGNSKQIILGNFYYDRNDQKKFAYKVEAKELIEAIDDLIELQSQNLKRVSQQEIADVVRKFFADNNISFEENRAITTSTIYFLANGLKIRVSDHDKVTNPSKMFTTSDPFFMQRYQKAQERELPNFDFVAGKYPSGKEYFENEMKRIFG
jgi:hypothetical protein